jgi:hypothetical protein
MEAMILVRGWRPDAVRPDWRHAGVELWEVGVAIENEARGCPADAQHSLLAVLVPVAATIAALHRSKLLEVILRVTVQ